MNNLRNLLFSSYQRTTMTVLFAVLAIAIPITLTLVGQQQDIRQRAEDNDSRDSDSRQVTGQPLSGFRVFATSTRHKGGLGGIAGADAICQQRAQEASLTGVFKAWLSDSATDARDRILDGQFVRMDGALIAINSSDLLDGQLKNSIDRNEKGQRIRNDEDTWTGTKRDGTRTDKTCSNWTDTSSRDKGTRGNTDQKDDEWTDDGREDCDESYRIYCFEIPAPSPTVSPPTSPTPILPPEYQDVIDLNDDGRIDELDLNILYAGFAKRKGD